MQAKQECCSQRINPAQVAASLASAICRTFRPSSHKPNNSASTETKNVAASAAVQFKLIVIIAAVTANWLTNPTELNTNMNNHTIQS